MVGVYIGSGIGGFATIEREHTILMGAGPVAHQPLLHPAAIVNLASGWISIPLRGQGAQLRHLHRLHDVGARDRRLYRLIQRGDADAMIAGGSEAPSRPWAWGVRGHARALHAQRPAGEGLAAFDLGRDGFVIGEGAGVVILEELEAARRRGAHVYCELVGYGMSSDAYHISAPCEDGDGAYRVMKKAIKDARSSRPPSGTSTCTGLRPRRATRSSHRDQGACSATTRGSCPSAPRSR